MTPYRYLYQWSARTLTGVISEGEIIARSRWQARQSLRQQALCVIKLQCLARVPPSHWNSASKRLQFTHQLALLLSHGVILTEALRLVSISESTVAWRWVWQQLRKTIAKGGSLSQALQQYPSLFSPLYCALIRVGEWSGQLASCCQQLVQKQEKQQQLQQSLRKALLYPLFTLAVSLFVTGIMLIVAIPSLQTIYSTNHQLLPPLTRVLIQLSQSLKQYGIQSLFVLMGLLIAYSIGRYRQPNWRIKEQQLLLQFPLLGNLLKQSYCAQFTRILAITHGAGLPMPFGLQIAGDSSGNLLFQQMATTMVQAIQRGHSLKQVFCHPLFPLFVPQMIAVGEAMGDLKSALLLIAEYYEKQTLHTTAYLFTLLEPLLVIIIGLIVGTLVIALYLPIFQLSQTIQ